MKEDRHITWLHISDLHFCVPKTGWRAGKLLRTLREDLLQLHHEFGLKPDLVFVTGDVAFGQLKNKSGGSIRDQYSEAKSFFEGLLEIYSPPIPLSNLFIVPGNHDIDRTTISEETSLWLSRIDATRVTAMIRDTDPQWMRVCERQNAYREFLGSLGASHLLGDSKRLIFSQTRVLGETKVGVAGFNSAWSCQEDNEKGKLWMGGDWQVSTLESQLADVDIRVALMHHPPGWFEQREDPSLTQWLSSRFEVCLHGHEHDGWFAQDGRHLRVAAGAAYGDTDAETGYNLVRLDRFTGDVEIWLREYTNKGKGGWVPMAIPGRTDSVGRKTLSDLGWLGSTTRAQFTGGVTNQSTETEFKLASPTNTQFKFSTVQNPSWVKQRLMDICGSHGMYCGAPRPHIITDTYYDDSKRTLAMTGRVIRCRRKGDQAWITLKSKNRKASSLPGALVRNEKEFMADHRIVTELDTGTVPKRITEIFWQELQTDISDVGANFCRVLTVHNERTEMPLSLQQDPGINEYTFCYDRYYYEADGDFSEYFSEMEIEIEVEKPSPESTLNIQKVIQSLRMITDYSTHTYSKYKRGVAWMNSRDKAEKSWLLGLHVPDLTAQHPHAQRQILQTLMHYIKEAIEAEGYPSEDILEFQLNDGAILALDTISAGIVDSLRDARRRIQSVYNPSHSKYAFDFGASLRLGKLIRYSGVAENLVFRYIVDQDISLAAVRVGHLYLDGSSISETDVHEPVISF